MARPAKPPGPALAAYLGLSRAIPALAPAILRRRLARGREDPARWREKLGEPGAERPEGRLVWLHAVGLGEVLALRGLIGALAQADGGLSFLVTSSARSSAQVMAGNLPPRTLHQYLPLDAPAYLRRFLAHWRPDLSVWAEQDLWPGAIWAADRAGLPLALVNARMNAAAYRRRARAAGLYRDLLGRFRLVTAQDAETAGNLASLGARAVTVEGSLKAASPPLAANPAEVEAMRAALAGRRLWLVASSHAEDEAAALAAQAMLWRADPAWLLVIVPRDPGRGAGILKAAGDHGLSATLSGQNDAPGSGGPKIGQFSGAQKIGQFSAPAPAAVHVDAGFGRLGLWYRLAPAALIGGSFGATEGHNPWEAAALGAAILHGPRIAHFVNDYSALHAAEAARQVTAGTLAEALSDPDLPPMAARARALQEAQRDTLAPLAARLIALMEAA